jgi:hypothetical protein
MAYDKLVLHPMNPRAILHDPGLLLDALRAKGLIGSSFGWDGEVHYAAGPRFRQLVLVRRVREPDLPEPHVSVAETAEEPQFLGATHARAPRCPWCSGTFSDWKAQLRAWQREGHRGFWTCTRCRRAVEVHRLEWAHMGGIARYSLDLWGIRQNAAIPSPELVALLESVTFEKWNYLYYQLRTDTPRGASSTAYAPGVHCRSGHTPPFRLTLRPRGGMAILGGPR